MMLSVVAKVAPTIYDFCKNVYSFQPNLDYHNKEIRSATGMQQGDPLGSLLFCITGALNLLKRVDHEFCDSVAEHHWILCHWCIM